MTDKPGMDADSSHQPYVPPDQSPAEFSLKAVLLGIVFGATYGFGTEALPAPQATLMKVVIEGVLERNLPWLFVGIGVGIALFCEAIKIPSLPFAVGVYLPVSTMVPVFLGGLLRWTIERKPASSEQCMLQRERGILFGSGLFGGEGLLGVGIAAVAVFLKDIPKGVGYDWAGSWAPGLGILALVLLIGVFRRLISKA
ncbi:OPT/YSL family transporter [Planctomycetota bacterium]